MSRFYNFYIVLKYNWVILLFHLIGFLALVKFEQGTDIVRMLSLKEPGIVQRQTIWLMIAVFWWSWQSWRASRVTLHLTHLQFKQINKDYALRSQVIIPRVLGTIPSIIMIIGLVSAGKTWQNPLIYVFLSFGFWFYVFVHFRKDLILFFLKINNFKIPFLDDYTLIKNEQYPLSFIWKKQKIWIALRILIIIIFFILVIVNPVSVPQFFGAAAIVVFSLGSWLVIAIFVNFAQRYLLFPVAFSILVLIIFFSFFNNNHAIRTLAPLPYALTNSEDHFLKWYHERKIKDDSIPVFLIAAEGGGIRSALWTSATLEYLQKENPHFDAHIYHFSSVSGGSLGVATYLALKNEEKSKDQLKALLNQDFLSPVTAGLVIPDLLQKFIPIPIHQFDRAKYLEYSWETAALSVGTPFFHQGFAHTFSEHSPLIIFNSTLVENGKKVFISNVNLSQQYFGEDLSFYNMQSNDIRISTAIGLSSRFPFLTPPGQITRSKDGKKLHLVDGGYSENSGGETLLKTYNQLQHLRDKHHLKVKFHLVFIKNTENPREGSIGPFYEIVAPLMTFSKVWTNSNVYTQNYLKQNYLSSTDAVHFVQLERRKEDIIPLGWYLSPTAFNEILNQVPLQTFDFNQKLKKLFMVKK